MKAQLKSMGLSLDWAREIATCDPAYYKHQQKMFLDFLAAGLVERKQSKVNWDPVDQTVLANEQVIDGRGWRSGARGRAARADAVVLQDHATIREELLDALDTLDRWPEKVRLMQQNWIGRSEGLLVRFALDPQDRRPAGETRARGLHHAARHAVRREVRGARARSSAGDRGGGEESRARRVHRRVQAPRHRAAESSRPPRSRASTPASAAIHPFDPAWKLPVYVANFILMDYGTGAIFGCPAHDQRDLDFVNKYGLGNTPVVCPPGQDPKTFVITDTAYDGDGR